jgi:hypothetical protein
VRNLGEFRSPVVATRRSGWEQALQAFTTYFPRAYRHAMTPTIIYIIGRVTPHGRVTFRVGDGDVDGLVLVLSVDGHCSGSALGGDWTEFLADMPVSLICSGWLMLGGSHSRSSHSPADRTGRCGKHLR